MTKNEHTEKPMSDEERHRKFPCTRPGVNFTPEQEKAIRDAMESGRLAQAQKLILDQLEKDNPHD